MLLGQRWANVPLLSGIDPSQFIRQCNFDKNYTHGCHGELAEFLSPNGLCYTFNADGSHGTKYSGSSHNLEMSIDIHSDRYSWGSDLASGIQVHVFQYTSISYFNIPYLILFQNSRLFLQDTQLLDLFQWVMFVGLWFLNILLVVIFPDMLFDLPSVLCRFCFFYFVLQVLVHDPLEMPRVKNDGFRVKAGSSVYAEITKHEVNKHKYK